MAEWDRRFPGSLDGLFIMAGAANVIMQLAQRAVGYGVMESPVESGQLFRHPLKRARTTFTYLVVALLGTAEEKLAYRAALTKIHALVRSTEKSPVKYSGLDPNLQMWVGACLYWGFIDAYAKLRGKLDQAKAEQLHKLISPVATMLQVTSEMWPATREAFDAYFQRSLDQVHIDDKVRAYLMGVAGLKFMDPVTRFLFGGLTRFLTKGFLPPQVREQMGFSWTPAQQRRFDGYLKFVTTVNRFMPRFVRQLGIAVILWDFRLRRRLGLRLV